MIRTEEANQIKARGVASSIIEECGLESPEQIELEKIALSRGLHIVEGPLIGADARLIRKGEKGLLRIKEGIADLGKKRFVIAHDMGHWELHKNQSQWEVFIDSDIQGYLHSSMELEATMFASELLMPTKMFRPYCEDVEPGLKEIKMLAGIFKVSLTAAAIRFIQESSYPCAIVFSDKGKVTWWKANDNCPKIWIEKERQIHKYSFAWECAQSDNLEIRGGDLEDSKIWFDSGFERIYEESIKLGKYGTVLSLLWLI